MDKRVLMATVVSMGVVLIWITFFGKPKSGRQAAGSAGVRQQPVGDGESADGQGGGRAGEAGRGEAVGAERRPAGAARRRSRRRPKTTLEEPKRYRATFTLGGRGADALGAARRAVQGRQSAREQQAGGADRSGQDAVAQPAARGHHLVDPERRSWYRSTSPPDAVWTEQPRTDRRRPRLRLGRRRRSRREAVRDGARHLPGARSVSPSRTRATRISRTTCSGGCSATRTRTSSRAACSASASAQTERRVLRQRQGQARQLRRARSRRALSTRRATCVGWRSASSTS